MPRRAGEAVFAESGTFDSLNPYVLAGNAPWPVQVHMVESLMARSYDEPFTLYGLLAESVEVPEDRSWVAFTLREAARFSDGSPVTVEDVIWSFEALGTEGHPRYRNAWGAIDGIEQTGPQSLRIDFKSSNRELPLILGLRPVLKKAQFAGRALDDAPMEPLIGSGPYLLDRADPGRALVFRKNPDWWGRDLRVNRGLNNFETVRYEYFRDASAVWEAVRSGSISLWADYDPVRWEEEYDFPALTDGRLLRGAFPHSRPSGMRGFVLNTRRAPFADRRVRQALALSFDWEWINDRLYRGKLARMTQFFGGSPLAYEGPATAGERAILAPFAGVLPDEVFGEGWQPPVSDGTGRNRRNLRRAAALLDEAGWAVSGEFRRNAEGTPFVFEILVTGGQDETLASLWRDALSRLGIGADIRLVDRAQYNLRRTDYDFDVIVNFWGMSLSPGTEQRLYFGSYGRETPGTRNYMGVADPAVDAAIDAMLTARETPEFLDAVRALDRVLTGGIYVIPFGSLPDDRLVWQAGLKRPEATPLYGWWGWWSGPALWWRE